VTDGIQSALEQAKVAAGGKDVRVGGGAATIRQYLQAGLVDDMLIAISPVPLGRGEPLFKDIDLPKLGYAIVEHVPTQSATHLVLAKR
jgi:dihydrofolate reductase